MPSLQIKRGTKAQLDSAASNSLLLVGELYLITDTNEFAYAISINNYNVVATATYQAGTATKGMSIAMSIIFGG